MAFKYSLNPFTKRLEARRRCGGLRLFRGSLHSPPSRSLYLGSLRAAAFKLPYIVDAQREVLGSSGDKVVQRDQGLGDLTLALPLKQYFNLAARSGNWTLAPQVRVPWAKPTTVTKSLTASGAADCSRAMRRRPTTGSLLPGSVSGFEGPEPAEWHYSLDLGWNALDYLQILWESDLHWDDDDAFIVSASPPSMPASATSSTHDSNGSTTSSLRLAATSPTTATETAGASASALFFNPAFYVSKNHYTRHKQPAAKRHKPVAEAGVVTLFTQPLAVLKNCEVTSATKIRATRFVPQDLANRPVGINPAAPTAISATQYRTPVLYRSQHGVRGVLLGTSFFSVPGIICSHENQLRARTHAASRQSRKDIFIADQRSNLPLASSRLQWDQARIAPGKHSPPSGTTFDESNGSGTYSQTAPARASRNIPRASRPPDRLEKSRSASGLLPDHPSKPSFPSELACPTRG